MAILGDAPDLGAIGDYLDYLDVHDLRALGVDTMEPAPMKPRAVQVARSAPSAAPLAPARVQYTAAPSLTRTAPMAATRLVSAAIPAGRVVSLPFGVRVPTLLNPGTPVDQPTGFGPTMMAAPAQAPVQTYSAVPTGDTSSLSPGQTSYVQQSTQVPTDTGLPDGSSSQGTSGQSGSSFGWLALAVGAYVMWRAL